MKVTIVKKF